MKILKCDLHDYLEIACMYKILVQLTLMDGQQYLGTPVTTGVNKVSRQEYLEVSLQQSGESVHIPVLDLQAMKAVVPTPHFDEIQFS